MYNLMHVHYNLDIVQEFLQVFLLSTPRKKERKDEKKKEINIMYKEMHGGKKKKKKGSKPQFGALALSAYSQCEFFLFFETIYLLRIVDLSTMDPQNLSSNHSQVLVVERGQISHAEDKAFLG